MKATMNTLVFVCTIWLCAIACQGSENTATDPWDLEIAGFSCTNTPVSQAVALLSRKVPIPINCIIDCTEEPRVSVSFLSSHLKDALREILSPLTNYDMVVKSATVLVLPKGLLDDKTCPLNQVIAAYKVTYIAIGGTTNHGCLFSYTSNTSLPVATFDKSPPLNYSSLPLLATSRIKHYWKS